MASIHLVESTVCACPDFCPSYPKLFNSSLTRPKCFVCAGLTTLTRCPASLRKTLARRRVFQFSATSNFCFAMSMPSQAVMAIPMYSEVFTRSRGQCLLFVDLVHRVRCDPPQDTVRSDQQSMEERGQDLV